MEIRSILVATHSLSTLGGTETYTYTLIEELKKRLKFNIEYFTFQKGLISERIENDLDVTFMSKNKYDFILANHNTCIDHLYERGFIIQTCHGIFPDLEQPSFRADGYVSISQEVQRHLAIKGFYSIIILNGINLERFKISNPVSKTVKTLLSLCHSSEANDFLEEICMTQKIKFIKAYKYENPLWDIEKVINKADIVVGLGRSAYEAMACGRPVIIYDKRKYFESYGDGYIKDFLGFSLHFNCSGRYTKNSMNRECVQLEIEKYNSEDSNFFRLFAEKNLDIKNIVDEYLSYFYILNNIKKKIEKKHLFEILKLNLGRKNVKKIMDLKTQWVNIFK